MSSKSNEPHTAKVLENNALTEIEPLQYEILKVIQQSEEPIGSLTLQLELSGDGIAVSSATIGRYLKELDFKGFTVRDSNKGRMLTELGRSVLAQMQKSKISSELHASIRHSVSASSYDDLIKIYRVRQAIEQEAVCEAMEHPLSQEQSERIRRTIVSYKQSVTDEVEFIDPALDFHMSIAECTRNRFLEAMLRMLIFEQKVLEDSFEALITREHGLEYSWEHETIYKAMLRGDKDSAVELMNRHFTTMINQLQVEKASKYTPTSM